MLRKNQAAMKRAKAFELFDEGIECTNVAERLGVSGATCRVWLRKWKIARKLKKGRGIHGNNKD